MTKKNYISKGKVLMVLAAAFMLAGLAFAFGGAGSVYAKAWAQSESIYAEHQQTEQVTLARPHNTFADYTLHFRGEKIGIELSEQINMIMISSIAQDGDIGEELASFSNVREILLMAEDFPEKCIIEYFNATNISFTATMYYNPAYAVHRAQETVTLTRPSDVARDFTLKFQNKNISISMSQTINMIIVFSVGRDGEVGEELAAYSNVSQVYLPKSRFPEVCIIEYYNARTITFTAAMRRTQDIIVGFEDWYADYLVDGTDDHIQLGQALADASEHDTIWVDTGTYHIAGSLKFDRDFVSMRGYPGSKFVLDMPAGATESAVMIGANECLMERIEFVTANRGSSFNKVEFTEASEYSNLKDSKFTGFGLALSFSGVVDWILDNTFEDCTMAIDLRDSDSTGIYSCAFTDCGTAIGQTSRGEGYTIDENTFENCDAGIELFPGAFYLNISSNVFEYCDVAISIDDTTSSYIFYNAIVGSRIGLMLINSDYVEICDNTFASNERGLVSHDSSALSINGNTFSYNTYGLSMYNFDVHSFDGNIFHQNENNIELFYQP